MEILRGFLVGFAIVVGGFCVLGSLDPVRLEHVAMFALAAWLLVRVMDPGHD